MNDSNRTRRRNDVNWSRFGLAENVQSSKQHELASNETESNNQSRKQHVRELFDEEVRCIEDIFWWLKNAWRFWTLLFAYFKAIVFGIIFRCLDIRIYSWLCVISLTTTGVLIRIMMCRFAVPVWVGLEQELNTRIKILGYNDI